MHSGELLRESVLPAMARPNAEVAMKLGLSTSALSSLVAESFPVTPELADRIGELAGNGSGLWLRLQENYDRGRG